MFFSPVVSIFWVGYSKALIRKALSTKQPSLSINSASKAGVSQTVWRGGLNPLFSCSCTGVWQSFALVGVQRMEALCVPGLVDTWISQVKASSHWWRWLHWTPSLLEWMTCLAYLDWNVSDMSLPSLSSVPCPGSMSESLFTIWLIFMGCYRLSLHFKEPLYGKRGWTKAQDHGISCPTTHCITQKMKPCKGLIKDICLTRVPVTSCEDRALVQRWNMYLKQWSLKILIPDR